MQDSALNIHQPRSKLRRATPWLLAFAMVFAVAAAGSTFPPDAWFEAIVKPTWQPPTWVFAPVWTTLYVMMACSLALLISSPADRMRSKALLVFGVHMALNAAWTPLFFGLHSPQLALLTIALLWLTLIGSISLNLRVNTTSGWLLLPTLAWVTFALVLNGVIVALNAPL